MKYSNILSIIIIWVVIAMVFMLPLTCKRKSLDKLNDKAKESFNIDSVKTVEYLKSNERFDSIVKAKQASDSIAKKKYDNLAIEYNRLLSLVKDLRTIRRIDSAGQTVSIAVVQYNALIEANRLCDSMSAIQQARIIEKDSLFNDCMNKKNEGLDVIKTKQQALDDYKAFAEAQEKENKKLHKSGKNKFLLGLAIPPALYIIFKVAFL